MGNESNNSKMEAETKAYLAKIQRTVAESKALLAQVELRMAETDRLLESQGLTREQVMSMKFTEEQKKAVNAELARRGMDPIEFADQNEAPVEPTGMAPSSKGRTPSVALDADGSAEDIENRRRKFNVMMNGIKL